MKKTLVITGLVLFLGTLVWCCWPNTPLPDHTSSGTAPSTHAGTSHAPGGKRVTALTWKWPKGASISYDFTTETELNLGSSGNLAVTVSGCWHVVVLDEGLADGTVKLATVFSDVSYISGTTPAPFYSQMLEQVPCLLRLSRDGKILGWEFAAYVRAEDRQIIAGLNSVQVQIGTPDVAGAWHAEEQDANGTAAVSYQTKANGLIRKQRTAFTRLSAQGIGPDSALHITASEFTASPGPVWFKTFEGNESMEFIYQGQPSWHSRQQVRLAARTDTPVPGILTTLAQFGSVPEAVAHLSGDLPEIVRLAGSGSITGLETAAARKALYANVDFTTIMRNFAQSMANAKSQADRQPAIENLRDWLLARPEEAGKLAAYLVDKSMPEENSACIFNALELSSASPASQAMLATVLADLNRQTYSDAMLVQAAIAAGGVGEITEQSLMDQLYHLAFTLDLPGITQASDCALFALGTLSRTNPAIRERLATELCDTLNEPVSGNEGYIACALMALANGGIRSDSLAASATRLFTESPSDNVRAEGLAYLFPTGDSSRVSAALADPSVAVQTRAVELLTSPDKMPADAVTAVTATLRNPATDPSVRANAAQLLKRHEAESANIATAYSETLAQNPPANLRELIESLTTLTAQP